MLKQDQKRKLDWKKFDPLVTEILPGMLLKVHEEMDGFKKGEQPVSIHLVGNVNKNLGVCDDCTNFGEEDIMEYSTDFMKEISEHLGTFYGGTRLSKKKKPKKK